MQQLFYLTNHELTAFAWQGRQLTRTASYENEAEGWRRFGDDLALAPAPPTYLLVDVIEEDFQRDAVPHVRGKARAALVERRLGQLYRDTPFRHAAAQGRDKEGRKDDRYLFNALTNADLPKPWLAAMLAASVPLVGMYSLASLSQQLFDRLAPGTGPVLLVSHQSSGLRQSYFHEGYLRFSRLTPLFDHAPERLVEAFTVETGKTRQFLASTRLLARGEPVRVLVLANPDNLAALASVAVDNADATFDLRSTEQLQQTLKLGQFDTSRDCDALYLALLATRPPRSHFPLRDLRHFYQLLRTRRHLYVASLVVAVVALAWAANDVWTVMALRRDAVRLEQEAGGAEQAYQRIIKDMPATRVTPHNMKSVVGLEQMTTRNVPLPTRHLAVLSQALEAVPRIALTSLNWQAVAPASLEPLPEGSEVAPAAPGEVAPDAAVLGLAGPTAQVLLIEGEVTAFEEDYRMAIDSVNRFAAALNRQAGLRAEITRQPIDLNPAVTLDSAAGVTDADARARFAIKLTWRP